MSTEEDDLTQNDDLIEEEYEDNPTEFEKLRPFDCPFCGTEIDWELGGCSHFVFSFEMVNFVYISIDSEFQALALGRFRELGHDVKELPCPLEDWAEYEDNEGEVHSVPSLDKVVPGLELLEHVYHAPHGHGSWGIVVGFMREMPRKGKQVLHRP